MDFEGCSRRYYGDRFLPARSSMDFDVAHYLLVGSRREKEETPQLTFLSTADYRKKLSEALDFRTSRVLSFWSKPSSGSLRKDVFIDSPEKRKPRRYISKSAEKTLYAPEILDDHCLNLLDWSDNNVVAIALRNGVCLWNASSKFCLDLMRVDEDNGPITSVSWASHAQHISVGINNSTVELWDVTSNQKLRVLQGGHQARVGSLSWNDHILTTGGMDSMIIDNDVRTRTHIVNTYRGHKKEVCSLKWSGSGRQLASGGDDDLLFIWDRAMASSSSATRWLHKFQHLSTVKALAWCPLQSNLIASSGGAEARHINFWNTQTGACLNSINTGSQVHSLLWSKSEKELLSSHGSMLNQLTLWQYPSMLKIAELIGHTSRVLFMAQSPDGSIVASAAGDQTMRFWNVFESPKVAEPMRQTAYVEILSNLNHIR